MSAPAPLAAALLAALFVPALAHADAMVNGSHRTVMLDCNNGRATVNGDGNKVVFHGTCQSLNVAGADNQVEIDLQPGGALTITGAGNHVLYTPIVPGPTVALAGTDNSATAGTGGAASAALAPPVPAAPPPPAALSPPGRGPGTLLLRGDGVTESVTCAGRNVLIQGSGGRYVLRGGCRSVTVQGQGDMVQAELQPGSRIAIGGDGNTVRYTLISAGPPPVVSITGSGNQAVAASD